MTALTESIIYVSNSSYMYRSIRIRYTVSQYNMRMGSATGGGARGALAPPPQERMGGAVMRLAPPPNFLGKFCYETQLMYSVFL